MVLSPGMMLSHYRLVEKIGEGGMGVVYKGLDTKLNRHVAIKLLPQELTSDPERRLRFEREAQAAAALNHPNIAVIYEVGEHEGAPFIAMELMEGQTLRDLLLKNRPSLRESLRLALPIAEGLAHAHSHGIIHRDLKPDNVMITSERQVKLLDFGLAKLLQPEELASEKAKELHTRLETISRELTHAGKVFGTVAYMSPEQARGERVDHRSDLFSFGVMLYQMVTGQLPFKRKSDIETLHAIIAEDPPNLADVVEGAPADAEHLVRKAMEKDPDRRYQHADELATDLRNLQRDLDSGRVSISSGVIRRQAPRLRRSWAIASAIGAAVILLAGGVFLYDKSGQSNQISTAEKSISKTGAAVAEGRAVSVIGFENLSDPADSEHLGRMLMGLITTDLAESGGLSVISMPKVLAALRQVSGSDQGGFEVSVASEAAQLAGAEVMVVGQVGKIGERLILTAELIDVASGKTLGSHRKEAGSTSELFALAGAIAEEVRDRLGVTRGGTSTRPFDLSQALTDSPVAYKHYALGEIALHQMRWPDAIEHFDRAVREDPTFALAHYRMGMAHGWNGSDADAMSSLLNGQRYLRRLPERWQRVYEAFIDYSQREHERAYATLDDLVRSSPDIPDPYYLLGEIVTHDSRYFDPRRSKDLFERALQINPNFRIVLFHLMENYIVAGDLSTASQLIAGYKEEEPDDPSLATFEIQILNARGEYAEAANRGEELLAEGYREIWGQLWFAQLMVGNPDRAYLIADDAMKNEKGYVRSLALSSRGLAQVARGRLLDGLADLAGAVELLRGTRAWGGMPVVASMNHLSRAQVLEASGDVKGALAAAGEAIRIEPNLHPAYFWLGLIQLRANDRVAAQETLAALQRAARETGLAWRQVCVHLLQAEIHLDAGLQPAAVAELEKVSALPLEYRPGDEESIVRAHVAAASGDRSGAIAAYRTLLKPRAPDWYNTPTRIRALHWLAQLEEDAGDLEGARLHYREYLERWGTADLPIADVDVARARLAAIE